MSTKSKLLLANRQGEGKVGSIWVVGFDAYFGESALTMSILPKF
jgi:hypothetical protein